MCMSNCNCCGDQMTKPDPSDKRGCCIWRARELGAHYQKEYVGCAHSSYAAVFDALREYGMELIPQDTQDEAFKGIIGLTAGGGNMNEGTCGAIFGATFAASVILSASREKIDGDGGKNTWMVSQRIKDTVYKKFVEDTGAVICRDVLYKRWGASFLSQYPGRNKDFFNYSHGEICRTPEECIIGKAAGFAVETILDYIGGDDDLAWAWEAHKPTAKN